MKTGSTSTTQHDQRAFTLIEVMIAMGIFFLAIFSILALVSTNIRGARKLQQNPVDAGMLYAELSLTNKFNEGEESGDFGDLFPGYQWTRKITQVASNGLFQVDVAVYKPHGPSSDESHMSVLFYRPDSPMGMSFGGTGVGIGSR